MLSYDKGETMFKTKFKITFDYSALTTGLRAAGALLIGNSVLIFSNIIGTDTANADFLGGQILATGVIILLMFSFKVG